MKRRLRKILPKAFLGLSTEVQTQLKGLSNPDLTAFQPGFAFPNTFNPSNNVSNLNSSQNVNFSNSLISNSPEEEEEKEETKRQFGFNGRNFALLQGANTFLQGIGTNIENKRQEQSLIQNRLNPLTQAGYQSDNAKYGFGYGNSFKKGGYVIQKGDNLTKISKNFNIPISKILELNKQIIDPNKIYTDDTLNLNIPSKKGVPKFLEKITPKSPSIYEQTIPKGTSKITTPIEAPIPKVVTTRVAPVVKKPAQHIPIEGGAASALKNIKQTLAPSMVAKLSPNNIKELKPISPKFPNIYEQTVPKEVIKPSRLSQKDFEKKIFQSDFEFKENVFLQDPNISKIVKDKYIYDKKVNPNKKAIVVDTGTNTEYITLPNGNIKPIQVITGKSKNEDYYKNLGNVNASESSVSGKLTPKGKFSFRKFTGDGSEYNNNILAIGTGNDVSIIAQHQLYNPIVRGKLMNTGNPEDRYLSYGCVNCNKTDFEKYIKNNYNPWDSITILNSNKSLEEFEFANSKNASYKQLGGLTNSFKKGGPIIDNQNEKKVLSPAQQVALANSVAKNPKKINISSSTIPIIKQGYKSTPYSEALRNQRNNEYSRNKAMQNSDLAKTFSSFTSRGDNINAGVIGAETFANLNPIMSGPILSTSRLAPAIMHPTNNAYWGSDRSIGENALGVLGAVGDVAMVNPIINYAGQLSKEGLREGVDLFHPIGKALKKIEKKGITINASPQQIKNWQMQQVGITSLQRKGYFPGLSEIFSEYITPYSYDNPLKRVLDIPKKIIKKEKNSKKLSDVDAHFILSDQGKNLVSKPRYDAWRMYSGLPQKHGTFRIAETSPINHPSYSSKQLNNLEKFSLNNEKTLLRDLPNEMDMAHLFYADKQYLVDALPALKENLEKIKSIKNKNIDYSNDFIRTNVMGGYNRRYFNNKMEYNDIWDLDLKGKKVEKYFGKPFLSHGQLDYSFEPAINKINNLIQKGQHYKDFNIIESKNIFDKIDYNNINLKLSSINDLKNRKKQQGGFIEDNNTLKYKKGGPITDNLTYQKPVVSDFGYYQPDPGTISKTKDRSNLTNIYDVVTNPFTSAQQLVNKQPVTGRGKKNIYDYSLDAFPAMMAARTLPNVPKNIKDKDYTSAALNLAGALPFVPKVVKAVPQTYKINPFASKNQSYQYLYRARPVGQNPNMNMTAQYEKYLAEGGKRDWVRDDIKDMVNGKKRDIAGIVAREKYYGKWFDSKPNRLDYYLDNLDGTSNFSPEDKLEILRLKLPKNQAKSFNVNNYKDVGHLSAAKDVEYILPADLISEAESFSPNDLSKLIQADKTFNTPHWFKGYPKTKKLKANYSHLKTTGKPYEQSPHIYKDMYPVKGIYQPRTVITDGAVKNEILGLEPTPVVPLNRIEYPNTPNKFLNKKFDDFGKMEKGVNNINPPRQSQENILNNLFKRTNPNPIENNPISNSFYSDRIPFSARGLYLPMDEGQLQKIYNFTNRKNFENFATNKDWARNSKWEEFGMEMRDVMNKLNLKPDVKLDVEKFRRIHLNEMNKHEVNKLNTNFKPYNFNNEFSINKLGGFAKKYEEGGEIEDEEVEDVNEHRLTEEDLDEEQYDMFEDPLSLFSTRKSSISTSDNNEMIEEESVEDNGDWISKFRKVEDRQMKFDHGNGAYGSFGYRKTGHLKEAFTNSPEFADMRNTYHNYDAFWNMLINSGYSNLSNIVDSKYEKWLKRQSGNNLAVAGRYNLTGSKSSKNENNGSNNMSTSGYINKLFNYKEGGTYYVDNVTLNNLKSAGIKYKIV